VSSTVSLSPCPSVVVTMFAAWTGRADRSIADAIPEQSMFLSFFIKYPLLSFSDAECLYNRYLFSLMDHAHESRTFASAGLTFLCIFMIKENNFCVNHITITVM